ncbi:hypothetical protein SteCoe_26932 [Stentor coeruleus]|uniref:CFA20 domain-containing protein n=1 Tax=Stentor coeruleus TaxID=5963 RepID=A0A1R2BBT1_9CILI|nr:hypothetical protein SteCoe_26932 [Stentor coeruleus]
MRNHVQYSEILNTVNKAGLKSVLLQGTVNVEYDSFCKCYLLNFDTGNLTIPRSPRETLEVVRPFLLLQVFVYPGKLMTIELATTDSDGMKRRLIFTQGKQVIRNAMHARIPHSIIMRNAWVNLSLDMSSIFTMCFPTHSFRSLDSIFISGTLKLRKIVSLMLPADELLPSISEVPKFPISTQELDSASFPQARPIYYSNSPAKVNKKYYYKPRASPFKQELESMKDLKAFKKDYIKSINLGARLLFRSPQRQESIDKEMKRKITHNHSRNMNRHEEDSIEESIEAEKSSWADMLTPSPQKNIENSPDYYLSKLSQICQVRHFTPPFVNLKDNITYNPVEKYYDGFQ